MARWMKDLKKALVDNGVDVWLAGFYVDDCRVVTPIIPPRLRWDHKTRRLKFNQAWMQEDLESDQDPGERTSHLILNIMNSLTPDIKFTVKLPSEFKRKRIPTLDSEWWIERSGDRQRLLYSFFRKPIASPYCMMESSAWAWNNKSRSLSQEVIRRMANISEHVPMEERADLSRTSRTC